MINRPRTRLKTPTV